MIGLLLLFVLDLRLYDVAVCHLADTLSLLADLQKTHGLLGGLLGCRVLALRDDQSVVVLGNGHSQPALRDFDLGFGQRLRRLGPPVSRHENGIRREFLMHNAPGAIHVDAVVCDKPAAGRKSVALRAEILRRMAHRWKQRGFRLNTVLAGNLGIRDGRLKLGIQPSGAFEGVLQSYKWRWRRLSLRLHELKRRAKAGILGRNAWDRDKRGD